MGPLQERETLVNPEARQPQRDLVTDASGRSFNRFGPGRATLGHEADAKEHDYEIFARQIAQRLNEARVRGELDKLVLVAAPAFLGLLRKNLDPHVLDLVTASIDKDLTQLRADKLRARLPQRLA